MQKIKDYKFLPLTCQVLSLCFIIVGVVLSQINIAIRLADLQTSIVELQEDIEFENHYLKLRLDNLKKQLSEIETTNEIATVAEAQKSTEVYLSKMQVEATAYCTENYPHICNNGDATSTATGTIPTPGRTLAVDPSIIPLGTSVVLVENSLPEQYKHLAAFDYVAEDTGGAIKGNKIDIVFSTHQEALDWGRRWIEIEIK